MLKPEWMELILSGEKDLEIRGQKGLTVRGKRIFLCESGTSTVFASAYVADILGPLSELEWIRLRDRHCVPGGRLYAKSYAWVLSVIQRLQHPVLISRKVGSIGIQKGPGSQA